MADEAQGAGTSGERYDAAYYAHGCGPRRYERDEVWLDFFGRVADRIVADIAPRRVMDVGCAMGFLVESLRERGVEAWGIDVSEYAISRVHERVRPFCRVASAAEPLGERYDLITCIEVLEHVPPAQSDAVIGNLCAHADETLFSSTPEDFAEPTHENVRPTEDWVAAFARRGFYRDVDYDAAYLTPWTLRLRKAEASLAPVVAAYERRLRWLAKESAALREARADEARRQAESEDRIAQLEARAALLEEELAETRARWAALRRSRLGRWAERRLPPG